MLYAMLQLTGARNGPGRQCNLTAPPCLQIFVDLVKHLYNSDIVGEDTINYWYKKGSVQRGRNVFLNDIKPFIQWLEEAEEDEDDEEE
jgi:eIF4-gamma/eIF5/eIF2-epsilon